MTRWNGESNENVYERCSMITQANGVKYGVVEWVKKQYFEVIGHIERMKRGAHIES